VHLLVVAVHDVAPSSLSEVRWLLARLDELGIRPRVLKAIPAPEGVEMDPQGEVAQLLREEQEAGSEIVVHGYTHRTTGPFRGSVVDTTRARLFAPDDAEFLSLDRAEAERRLARGRTVLEGAGLEVTGFCPPGWLAPSATNRLAAEQGYAYLVGLVHVVDLGRRRTWTVPPFGYMGADRTQERLVGIGGDTSLSLHRWLGGQVPHLRAFLHPARASTSDIAARTLERIGRLATHEPVVTYSQLLADGDAA
jgi:predicted deacetylase